MLQYEERMDSHIQNKDLNKIYLIVCCNNNATSKGKFNTICAIDEEKNNILIL